MGVTMARANRGGRRRGAAIALVATCACTLLTLELAAPAGAVPARFWGAASQEQLSIGQLQRIERGGVDSIRIQIDWGGVQESEGEPFRWAGADLAIADAARAGLEVLPCLSGAPGWAVRPGRVPGTRRERAPRHLPVAGRAGRGWAAFVRAAVERYGPRGSFWRENPGVPRRPIHSWQLWNEPNFKYFVVRPSPGEYGRLVQRSERAIHAADRRAKIVLGGLFAKPAEGAWRHRRPRQAYFATDFLQTMYRRTHGVRSMFDGVALHPYTADYRRLAPEIRAVRRVLSRNRDAGKGLWITEMGWSSQRPSRRNSFAKGVRGQARQLKGAFRLLRRNQRRWRLRRIYWFSVDDKPGVCNFCGGTGLFRRGFRPKPAWHAYVHFARGG